MKWARGAGLSGRLSLAGRYQGARAVPLGLVVDGARHVVDVQIVCFDKQGPKIELFNSDGLVHGWDLPAPGPSGEPLPRFQTPAGGYWSPEGGLPSGEHFAGPGLPSGEQFGAAGRFSGEHFGGMGLPSGEHFGGMGQPSGEYWNPGPQPSRERARGFAAPSDEPFGPYQPPSGEPPRGVAVESRESLRFRDCEELRSQVQIKGNVISIPAGMSNSYMFKVVVYNHSSRKINLDLSPLRSPFSCKYNNIVIEP